MSKKEQRFVLSDESVNSYGFIVKTLGINLERFKNNPVLLYDHDRTKIIGKWKDIEVKDGKLSAVPVFDEDDEFALKIKAKVESGFIKACSIGMSNIDFNHKTTPIIANTSELLEVSITPIPSNANALVLYDEAGTKLSEKQVQTSLSIGGTHLEQELQQLFNLTTSNPLELVNKVKELQASYNELSIKIKQQESKAIDNVIKEAMQKGQFLADEKQQYKELLESNFELGVKMIEKLEGKKTLAGKEILSNDDRSQEDWTLHDYRKHAPHLLRNKELYQELINKEYNTNK